MKWTPEYIAELRADIHQFREFLLERGDAPDLVEMCDLKLSIIDAAAERDRLVAFKAYVHKRLDDMGIPEDPDSPHKAEGCRIGGRLDCVEQRLKAGNEYRQACQDLLDNRPGQPPAMTVVISSL